MARVFLDSAFDVAGSLFFSPLDWGVPFKG
jgi:hypothetical protein